MITHYGCEVLLMLKEKRKLKEILKQTVAYCSYIRFVQQCIDHGILIRTKQNQYLFTQKGDKLVQHILNIKKYYPQKFVSLRKESFVP